MMLLQVFIKKNLWLAASIEFKVYLENFISSLDVKVSYNTRQQFVMVYRLPWSTG